MQLYGQLHIWKIWLHIHRFFRIDPYRTRRALRLDKRGCKKVETVIIVLIKHTFDFSFRRLHCIRNKWFIIYFHFHFQLLRIHDCIYIKVVRHFDVRLRVYQHFLTPRRLKIYILIISYPRNRRVILMAIFPINIVHFYIFYLIFSIFDKY